LTVSSPRPSARVIAYYLPQFHPIPENDAWWGKGFTEWTNVTKARPLFRGHQQPKLPADLGFYDLRVAEVREAQAGLARRYGVEGFCYWHYWFGGKRLLNRPLDEMRASGRPDFPFCIGWANETWNRRWTGEEREILMEQTYSHEDDVAHGRWLAELFADHRYIRIDGRPVFVLYRPSFLADPQRTTDTIRAECVRLGVAEPFIIGRDTHTPWSDMRPFGCDITEYAAPALGAIHRISSEPTYWDFIRNVRLGAPDPRLKVFDYEKACIQMEAMRPAHPHIRCFFVSWDNTPRHGRNAKILVNATPEAFGRRLRVVLDSLKDEPTNRRIVFINAWNEWAEGMVLEPSQQYGHGFLRALQAEVARPIPSAGSH
jgi:lipopolysaccharide biosynthesis protein